MDDRVELSLSGEKKTWWWGRPLRAATGKEDGRSGNEMLVLLMLSEEEYAE
jgi:hypothetical protein